MTKIKVAPRETKRLSGDQQHAVEICCDLANVIAGVTGGAGTGKTEVLGHVYRELTGRGLSVVLTAPTGRAAKRVQELTGIPAKTVHRLLQFPMPKGNVQEDEEDDNGDILDITNFDDEHEDIDEPLRNARNLLDEQVIIVDESSMIGPTLYGQLMAAIRKGAVVRFFGDNNQLPPVEEGEPPFIYILRKFVSVELTFNFRSDDEIVYNAERILRGRIPERNDRFKIIYDDNPIKRMLEIVTPEFKAHTHQVIMPTRRGRYGTMRVNPSLQARFNKKGEMLLLDRYDKTEAKLALREGDKFLWIKNDYKLEMFNGEIGSVDGLDLEDGSVSLSMPDRHLVVPARVKMYSRWHRRVIDYDPRKQLELGYAVTTHKAQGSEFDTVIYCIMRGQAYLLNRRNLYTAVTRAKNKVIIISDSKAMGLSMRRHTESR